MSDENFDLSTWVFAWRPYTAGNANAAAHRVQVGWRRGKLSNIDDGLKLSAAQSHSVFEKN